MEILDSLVIFSNLSAILPFYYTLLTKRYFSCFFITMASITSIFYHILWYIKIDISSYGLITFRNYLTYLDFHQECLALISVCIDIFIYNRKIETIIHIIMYIVFMTNVLIVSFFFHIDEKNPYFYFDIGNKLIIIIILILFLSSHVIYQFYQIYKNGTRINKFYLFLSLFLSIVSPVFFWTGGVIHYWLFHSLWHICIFLLPVCIYKTIDEKKNIFNFERKRHVRTRSNFF